VERHDSGNVNGAAETFYNRGTSFAQIGGSLGSAVSENTNDLLFLVTSNIIFSATTGANGYYVSTRWDNAGNIKTLGAVNATNGFAVGAAAGESYVLTIQTNAIGPHGYTITFTGGIETAHAQY
jgi:hypothetical protein